MKTTHLCRCTHGNDMTCPAAQPLEKLITQLTKAGSEKEIHVVDAMWAKSPLVECSNCDSRGGFDAARGSGSTSTPAPLPDHARRAGSCGNSLRPA